MGRDKKPEISVFEWARGSVLSNMTQLAGLKDQSGCLGGGWVLRVKSEIGKVFIECCVGSFVYFSSNPPSASK